LAGNPAITVAGSDQQCTIAGRNLRIASPTAAPRCTTLKWPISGMKGPSPYSSAAISPGAAMSSQPVAQDMSTPSAANSASKVGSPGGALARAKISTV
jgi:hypothetical protein